MDYLCYLCLAFLIPSRLFVAALWSPAGKGLTSLLSFVICNCVFVTFPCGILGQMWYLIVSIHDLYHISYFNTIYLKIFIHNRDDFKIMTAFIQKNLSLDMGFPTMWYVRPVKPQISLRIGAV